MTFVYHFVLFYMLFVSKACENRATNNAHGHRVDLRLMIKTRFYLDSRKIKPGSPAILKYVIPKGNTKALISLNFRLPPDQWDPGTQEATGKSKHLNPLIMELKLSYDAILMRLEADGLLKAKTANEIKNLLVNKLSESENEESKPSETGQFITRFIEFRDRHKGRTWDIYEHTLGRIKAHVGESAMNKLTFEDITPKWLREFDAFLDKTSNSVNGRNIHMRNIRAVFNDALDDEITVYYPFRKFKIKNEPTRKRSMEVEDLRNLFSMQVSPREEIYRDVFKLIFFLIGINTVDLYSLKSVSKSGRIEYKRAKTGRMYSIKLEPEAKKID